MDKKRILVVEDEKDMLFAVKLFLESRQFEVLAASDGQEALEKARRENPDLIILDVMLPKIEGYKVCRMLKFDTKYSNIPIIIFTARVHPNDEKVGYEVGADAYLTKPFEPEVLIQKIDQLLQANKKKTKVRREDVE